MLVFGKGLIVHGDILPGPVRDWQWVEEARGTIAGDGGTSTGPTGVDVLSDIIGEAFPVVFTGD